MGKINTITIKTLCCASALLATSIRATPPCDDVTKAEGCIDLSGGGTGMFTLAASYDAGTGGKSGSLKYIDTANNFQVTSSTVQDISYLDANVRGFIFQVAAADYNEVRVFVSDWGSAGDQFEIQLLQNGTIIYDEHNTLSSDCTGAGINGVVIASNCNDCDCPTPTPNPNPNPNPHPKPPPHYDHCWHHLNGKHGPCPTSCPKPPVKGDKGGKNNRKGNNGVGNGVDPQPPGNPPINDGPGTSPGNPGNRGGAGPNKQK
jgi:hypothetical protein